VIDRVCLFGRLVRSFVNTGPSGSDFSQSKSPIFTKVSADVHHLRLMSLLTLQQGQGQSSRSKTGALKIFNLQ